MKQQMQVIFSNHAKGQLKRRSISQRLVIKVIKNSKEITMSFRGRKLHRIKIGDKILEVITKTEDKKVIIITAYYLEV